MSDGPRSYSVIWDGDELKYPLNGQWYSIPSSVFPAGLPAPSFTTTTRDAIASPTVGLIILNTTTNKLNFYGTDSAWHAVTSA